MKLTEFLNHELVKSFNAENETIMETLSKVYENIKNKKKIGNNTIKMALKNYFDTSFRINQINYWLIRGWTEQEGTEKIKKMQKGRTKNQVEYWLKKGYSQEDAEKEVSKFQSERALKAVEKGAHKGKFSKKWFQDHYGDDWENEYKKHNEKKTKKIKKSEMSDDEWKEVVEKKRKTYYSKSDEERKEINKRRTIKLKKGKNNLYSEEDFIKKFGEEEGKLKWKERNKKISDALNLSSSFRNSLIQEKAKQTILKKYGTTSVCKNKKIKEKLKNTLSEVYFEKLLKKLKHVKPLFEKKDYINIEKEYFWKCLNCGLEFNMHLKYGEPRCPICEPLNTSKGELELREFIINELHLTDVKTNNKNILNGKELDVYMPQLNLAIEYNGIYWHSELNGKDANYHLYKTEKCEEQNIQLIHIFESEWNKKKEIVKSILRSKTNKIKNKIFARKCIIIEIDNETKNMFLNNNHIQGEDNSSIKLGLQFEDKIVSVLSFTKNKNKNKNYEWELSRFASLINHTVVGGFSKLLKFFIKKYKPKSIGSYADLRYSNGNLYKKNGFIEQHRNKPRYWYFSSSEKLFHRQNFQKTHIKNKLEFFNDELTEWENMQMNGFDRIWDVGNILFILDIK